MSAIYVSKESGHRVKVKHISIFGRGKWIGEIFTLVDRAGREGMYNRQELNSLFTRIK